MKSLSIRNRLILAMLVAVVVSTGVVAYIGQEKSQEMLLTRLETYELPNLVQRIEQTVSSDMEKMKAVTYAIANNDFIQDSINKGLSKDDEKRLTTYLKKIAEENGLSNASYADRKTAKYWNQDGFLKVLTKEEDGWFFSFKSSGSEELASTYTYDDGKVDIFVNFQQLSGRGASGVSKSFEDIANLLRSFKIEETGFVYLVDSKGLIKVHKDREYTEKKHIQDLFSKLNYSQLFSEKEFSLQSVDGKIISTSYIESLDWYVVAEVPEAELYAVLDESRNYMLFMFMIVVVIFIGLSILMSNSLVRPLKKMAQTFQDLAKGDGDLTSRIDEDGAVEIKELATGFNSFVYNIHSVMQDVSNTSKDVRNAAENVHQDAASSKVISVKQRDETHQVSVAITEMGSTVAEIASSASVAAQTTNDAASMAIGAKEVVNESTTTISNMAEEMNVVSSDIESLAENTNNISAVLEVIRGISDQTNLLALNAAIEAARAGEHGRGFSVVADEVRNLAKRTSEATDEIHVMISELQDKTTTTVQSVHQSRNMAIKGVVSAQKTNETLEEIVSNVQHISDLNTQIATATEEQAAVISEINVHVVNINDSTEQNAEAITSIESSSDSMNTVAGQLEGLVNRFKI